jgi:hypothetical protein
MPQSTADLQQLKGIGAARAKRLSDAGLDTFAKIAQAGEKALKGLPGMNPNAAASILEQARQLAHLQAPGSPSREERMKQHLMEVRQQVEAVAQATKERFQQDLAGKRGKKLSADLIRMEDALMRMDGKGKKRRKRAEKALTVAEKRISGLNDVSLKKVRKGLKRARKAVLKAL